MITTELRRGNKMDYMGNIITIEGIQPNYVWSDYQTGNIHALHLKPIPLSEEWLVRFEFEKEGYTYDKDELYFQMAFSEKSVIWKFTHTYPRQKEIYFVHQLQNLYFALTGTELELKY